MRPESRNSILQTDPELFSPFLKIDLTGRRAIVAAISGGSDSTALLLLAQAWLDATAPAAKLVAVTIDHQLRPESVTEARQVGRLCAERGIAHRVVQWDSKKPESGLSAAARLARYQLLAEAARAAGADIVLTGHTLDDQTETVSMRGVRGEGRGLAAMAPATLFDGSIWIVRPLLGLRRETLRDFLRRNGTAWTEDPTNTDFHYERARVRACLAVDDAASPSQSAIANAQRRRVKLGEEASAILGSEAARVSPGLIRLTPEFAKANPAEAAIYALRTLLAVTGGREHLPDEERSAGLFRRLKSAPFRATLSRSVVDARTSGIFIRRELRGLPQPETPYDGMVWDGRFRMKCAGNAAGLKLAPLTVENARKMMVAQPGVPQSLVRAALAAEPALWSGETFLGPAADPGAGDLGLRAVPIAAPWARFLPSFDLAVARALSELLGCESVPDLPFRSHNEG